ncbi:zinc finger protein 32-like [Penaeus monodon]|uniref:zinc finger protein 32-like n=1 Tax=Penaeus monodon TaxID=6687 RepID=UPI0018A74D0D|nr:zinc finger protein 32-like [Penaeus monodon]
MGDVDMRCGWETGRYADAETWNQAAWGKTFGTESKHKASHSPGSEYKVRWPFRECKTQQKKETKEGYHICNSHEERAFFTSTITASHHTPQVFFIARVVVSLGERGAGSRAQRANLRVKEIAKGNPLQCEFCKKGFSEKYRLKINESHKKEKHTLCKKTSQKNQTHNPHRVHKREAISWRFAKRAFSRELSRNPHESTKKRKSQRAISHINLAKYNYRVHKRRAIICEFCKKGFSQKGSLVGHKNT